MEKYNEELEIQVLGNCFDINKLEKALDKGIVAEDFYNSNNQKLYNALIECYSLKNSTDLYVFGEYLEKHGVTKTYFNNIMVGTIPITDIAPYFNELFNLRVNRERLKLAADIQTGVLKTDEDIKNRLESIDFIKSKVGNDNTITTLDRVKIVDVYSLEKIPTGFTNIDHRLLGFAMGSLSIITGYNANGKSTLINQMCIAESMSHDYKVFAYSPELTNSNLKSWLYPTIANDEHFINKTFKGTQYKMNNLAAQGVKVFIIDNLMKIDLENSYKNEYIAQKIFVNKLKNFARKYNVIVHLVAHPKKPQAGNTKITKFDVAGTGDITNLADYVISISRITDEDREKNHALIGKDAVIKIMKDRIKGNGEFANTFSFDNERKRFYSNQNELNKDYGYTNNLELVQVEMSDN